MDSHSRKFNTSFLTDTMSNDCVDFLHNSQDTIFLIYGGNDETVF